MAQKSWFSHEDCTRQEALELVNQYQKRGVRAEMLLGVDQKTWVVNAWLYEVNFLPRSNIQPNKCWM